MRYVTLSLLILLITGCGSKINEPNYYKVSEGDTAEQVEELLGPGEIIDAAAVLPATQPTTNPSTTKSSRIARRWQRGRLIIVVWFENERVVARQGKGLSAGDEYFEWPAAATFPIREKSPDD